MYASSTSVLCTPTGNPFTVRPSIVDCVLSIRFLGLLNFLRKVRGLSLQGGTEGLANIITFHDAILLGFGAL
jgi:hypothetical protein